MQVESIADYSKESILITSLENLFFSHFEQLLKTGLTEHVLVFVTVYKAQVCTDLFWDSHCTCTCNT